MTIPVIQNKVYRTGNLTVSNNPGRLILAFFNSDVSAVTFKNINMTRLASYISGEVDAECWYLFLDDSVSGGSYAFAATGLNRHFALEITGWNKTSPFNDSDTKYAVAGSDGIKSNSLDVVKDSLVVDFVCTQDQYSKSPAAGQTALYNNTSYPYAMSKKEISTDGTTTMRWTWSDNRGVHIAVVIAPVILSKGVTGVFLSDYGVM